MPRVQGATLWPCITLVTCDEARLSRVSWSSNFFSHHELVAQHPPYNTPMATASCSYTTLFQLDHRCPVPWINTSQEVRLHYEYPLWVKRGIHHYLWLTPFDSVEPVHADEGATEGALDYVIRRYLETLWIPEVVLVLAFNTL